MNTLFHILKVFKQILSHRYDHFSKTAITFNYLRLIWSTFRKSNNAFNSGDHYYEHKLFHYNIFFTSYRELINLFEEIFILEVYHFKSDKSSPVIIDGGSNIGLSILYFKIIYPEAKILAFEPDKRSFELLQQNIMNNHLKNVSLYNVALDDSVNEKILFASHPQSRVNNTLIDSGAGRKVSKVRTALLSNFINEEIDLVKLDIEGSEKAVVEDLNQTGKVDFIQNLFIEYHPRLVGLTETQFASVLENEFTVHRFVNPINKNAHNVMLYCYNKALKA